MPGAFTKTCSAKHLPGFIKTSFESAYKNKVPHFINLGSSCIYPKYSKQPIKEEYLLSGSLEKTNEAYAIAKIVWLKLFEYYNKQFKTSYLTIMPCNLYGPNDNFDLQNSHFIPALIRKIVKVSVHTQDPERTVIEILPGQLAWTDRTLIAVRELCKQETKSLELGIRHFGSELWILRDISG